MTPKIPLLAATTLAIAATQPAAKPTIAPSGPVPPTTTLNCIIASNVFVQHETDEKQKEMAQQTMTFYLGRLNPRTTETELRTGLKLAADGLKGTNALPLMNNCLHELQAKAQMLQAAGQQVEQGK